MVTVLVEDDRELTSPLLRILGGDGGNMALEHMTKSSIWQLGDGIERNARLTLQPLLEQHEEVSSHDLRLGPQCFHSTLPGINKQPYRSQASQGRHLAKDLEACNQRNTLITFEPVKPLPLLPHEST